jgi:hypothetical protein
MMCSSRIGKKMLVVALLTAPLGLFTPAAQAANRTPAQVLRLQAQLQAQIVVLTAQLAQASKDLQELQLILKVAPNAKNIQNLATTLSNVVQNTQAQLNKVQTENALAVQLAQSQVRLRELEIQLKSADRRVSRIQGHPIQGHPIIERIAERRIQRLDNTTVNDRKSIDALRAQIDTLNRQLDQLLGS